MSLPSDREVQTASPPVAVFPEIPTTPRPHALHEPEQAYARVRSPWLLAAREIAPLYVAIHLALGALTMFAMLFLVPDFSGQAYHTSQVIHLWLRWDTGWYMTVAEQGYAHDLNTAFFPLYPLMMRALALVVRNTFLAGLLISQTSWFGCMVVLYRLIQDDTQDQSCTRRTVLYFSIFPTAFFLCAAYNESLFIFCLLLSFYGMRKGHWWLAGIAGALAVATRSAGVFLALPFAYEYARQHQFRLRSIRLSFLWCALIPLTMLGYMLFCLVRFHDPLIFVHVEDLNWQRHGTFPFVGIYHALGALHHTALFSFQGLRNILDLLPCLTILGALALSVIGPWRLPRSLVSYAVCAIPLGLYALSAPTEGLYPLEAAPRYMLEVVPAFFLLARIGGFSRFFHLQYISVSTALLAFLTLQFLTGHWII